MEPQVVADERTARGRWRVWLVAGLMAAVGWTLSPADWPAETARLTVSSETGILLDASVPVGDPASLSIESGPISIEFPEGIGTSGRVAGTVSGVDPDAATVELILADGRVERLPGVSVDEAGATFEVSRRPPVNAGVVLALLGFVVVMWVTEAIPLFLTSLSIPVVLVVAGAAEPGDALAPFFHPIIALFFGGFLMAEAMKKVGLDRTAAVTLVAAAGRSPVSLLVGMMAVSAFLSMWMSNTAAAAVLVPIAIGVTAPIDHPGYRKVAVLGIAYAATLGGVGSAIGTPANPLAIEFLSSFAGREVSFAEWFGFGVPMVVIFLPVVAAYLWWRMGVKVDAATFDRVRAAALAEVHTAGRMDRGQRVVLGVFGAVMVAWLTQTWHGVDTGIVALGGALALGVLRMVDTDDLARISWSALLTFGGGLALGVYLTRTGTSDWLATRLVGLESVPSAVGVAAIATATLALTTVASNTATAAMMIPLAIPLAGVVGVDPSLLVVIVAIASSIDFALVIGTPPTMIAYSTKLFTTREIFRTGIVLDLLGVILLVTAVSWIWQVLGVL